jgi:hypothetical protein
MRRIRVAKERVYFEDRKRARASGIKKVVWDR